MERNALIDLLTKVMPGLATKEVVELSTSFIFSGGELITFNDDIHVAAKLPDELAELDGIAVEALPLYNLLRSVDLDTVEIKVLKNELRISGKGFKAGVRRREVEEPPKIKRPKKMTKLKPGFIEAVQDCMLSAGTDASRPLLTCIHCTPERVESCDNFRLTIFPMRTGLKEEILLPSRYVKILGSYQLAKAGTTSGFLHFETKDGVLFSCRTFDGEYPELDGVCEGGGEKFKVPRKLLDVLDAAGVFLAFQHKDDAEILVAIEDKKIKVRSTSEAGWYEGTCPIKYKGDPVNFRINPYMLKAVLDQEGTTKIGESSVIFETAEFFHQIAMIISDEEEE